MAEETSTKANGADTTPSKASSTKKPKKVREKRTAKKKTSGKKAAKKRSAKKTAAAAKKTASKATGKRGRAPRKALRVLLLEQAHPDWSGAKIASEVPCTPNFAYKVTSKAVRGRYEDALTALSEEERKGLLSAPVMETKKTKAKTKTVKAVVAKTEQQSEAELVSVVASFKRAVRFLGTHHARMLLEEFEQ